MGPMNYVLDEGQDRMNTFAAARGDKSAMRPFAKLLWTLVIIIIVSYNCHSYMNISISSYPDRDDTYLSN